MRNGFEVSDTFHSLCVQGGEENMDIRILTVLTLLDKYPSSGEPCCETAVLDSAAKLVNLSVSRLRHVFKQEIGLSPLQRQRRMRLSRARHLLQVSFLSVKEVAATVGVKDMSHFVRDYKLKYGETPSQTKASRT
jgi:AraC family transcriptional regulator of arabinose operon